MKICKNCKIEKELDKFNKNKNEKDGFYSICKICRKLRDTKYSAKAIIRSTAWTANNPEKNKVIKKKYRDTHKLESAQYYIDNKCILLSNMKEYRKNHKEEISKQHQEYYQKNKESFRVYGIKYRKNNKAIIKKQKADYYQKTKKKNRKNKNKKYNKQYGSDIIFRIKVCLRSRLRQALKKNSKTGSAVKDLGCSVDFFRKYIESKFYLRKSDHLVMNWDNYGKKWQIDHIKALCYFDLTDRKQLLLACHYTNLQPLWNEDHFNKTIIDINNKQ